MLRIVPHTVPRVGRSYDPFPDGFELHLLPGWVKGQGVAYPDRAAHATHCATYPTLCRPLI